MGSRRTLPIGIQTFRTIRDEGCYYVDKTPLRRAADRGRLPLLAMPFAGRHPDDTPPEWTL